ncbi:signal peptidase I [Patescibacteria group bacterium]|nr:signal peptidase I [Patescibacteria group bacterium]
MSFFKRVGNFFLDIIEAFVMAMALFVVIYLFLFQPHQVKGKSMYPNFHDKDYLLTDKISYRMGEPARGDIIIFKAPKNEDFDYIKRILGLPGETIRISDCHVYINNSLLEENYIPSNHCTQGGHFWQTDQNIPIPEENYFVLGDNREFSSDSREWGTVPIENIVGKASLRYWPIKDWGFIRKTEY